MKQNIYTIIAHILSALSVIYGWTVSANIDTVFQEHSMLLTQIKYLLYAILFEITAIAVGSTK